MCVCVRERERGGGQTDRQTDRGVTNYGNGWRTDAVTRCLEFGCMYPTHTEVQAVSSVTRASLWVGSCADSQ